MLKVRISSLFYPFNFSAAKLWRFIYEGFTINADRTYIFSESKDFDIDEMAPSGITAVTGIAAKEVARYDESGHLLTAPTKGVNIVRYSDGTVREVVVE